MKVNPEVAYRNWTGPATRRLTLLYRTRFSSHCASGTSVAHFKAALPN